MYDNGLLITGNYERRTKPILDENAFRKLLTMPFSNDSQNGDVFKMDVAELLQQQQPYWNQMKMLQTKRLYRKYFKDN